MTHPRLSRASLQAAPTTSSIAAAVLLSVSLLYLCFATLPSYQHGLHALSAAQLWERRFLIPGYSPLPPEYSLPWRACVGLAAASLRLLVIPTCSGLVLLTLVQRPRTLSPIRRWALLLSLTLSVSLLIATWGPTNAFLTWVLD